MSDTIRIGTRGSQLALWQANLIADLLNQGGITTEIIKIKTTGDQEQKVPIAEIGTRGVFTEAIEKKLHEGAIDIAVHSAKDMPSVIPDEFELIAFTKRELVNDVLLTNDPGMTLKKDGPPMTIGTSSVRREALLKHYYPQIKTTGIRGNLQTRIKKMEEGACDGILLAYAGVHRMGYDHKINQKLPVDIFVPPVGQGSITIEVSSSAGNTFKEKIKSHVNDPETESCLKAERSFLKTLRGGCSVPAFAHAFLQNDKIHISGGIISLDGRNKVQDSSTGSLDKAEILGDQLAQTLLNQGGDKILANIKNQLLD